MVVILSFGGYMITQLSGINLANLGLKTLALGLTAGLAYFTVSTSKEERLQKIMQKAEAIFKSGSSDEIKEQTKAQLCRAFIILKNICQQGERFALPTRCEEQAARLFHLYGRCVYGGNMEASRQYFQMSLAIQLYAEDTLSRTHLFNELKEWDSLEELPKEQLLSTQVASVILEGPASFESTDAKSAFDIATNLKWLGFSYQNIDRFRHASETNIERINAIYDLAKAIFARIDTVDSRWEVGEIIYNTSPFLHNLRHPGDHVGAAKTMEAVTPYLDKEGNSLRAKSRQAQIYNIQTILASRVPLPENSKEKEEWLKVLSAKATKAVEYAATVEGFDPFLKHNFINVRISCALRCIKEGFPMTDESIIGEWIKTTLSYAQKEKYNHYYHSSYFETAVKFAIYQKKFDLAAQYLDTMEMINRKFPESSEDSCEDAKILRLKLAELASIK